jgi:hypothetical protein
MARIIYNDIAYPLPHSYSDLKQQLGNIEIAYLDDEGDRITISNQYDLDQAFIYIQKEGIETLPIAEQDEEIGFDKTVSSVMLIRDEETINASEQINFKKRENNFNNKNVNRQPNKWFFYFFEDLLEVVNKGIQEKAISKPVLPRCYFTKNQETKRQNIAELINSLVDEKFQNLKTFYEKQRQSN